MVGDTEPREEFAAALREWFVDEVGRFDTDRRDAASAPMDQTDLELERPVSDQYRRSRPLMTLANAVAVLVVIVGLWWLATWVEEVPADPPVATAAVQEDEPDPVEVAGRVCEEFRIGAPRLVLGAAGGQVEKAAVDVRLRLVAAAASLDEEGPVPVLVEARRLLDEAIDAADRLLAVADEDRQSVDASVRNLDLIVVAWGRELAAVAGEACDDLPTLREVL